MKLIFICNNYRVFMMRLRNILCNKRLPCVKYKIMLTRYMNYATILPSTGDDFRWIQFCIMRLSLSASNWNLLWIADRTVHAEKVKE